jgi:glycosyltransferase involved in cell wall biosynthesis
MAKVSVVMPAHNVASYIGAAIASVQAQTHRDWELLIVDDGSTDETGAIAEACADHDRRIRVFHQENAGISAARNTALARSTGEFIAILDSDDLWQPQFLEAQLAVFGQHPQADVVTGNGWFLGGRTHGRTARPFPDSRPQPTLETILADETAIFIMCVFRRRVYEAIGGFDESLRTNEDYDYWLRAAIAGFGFRRNDRPLAHYRRRDDSMSAVEVRMLTGILRVFTKLRPSLLGSPAELAILDQQCARFERELLAAQARFALSTGEQQAAADHLSALYARGGGPVVGVASFMARRAPRLLSRAYQLRRACLRTS